jgi:hypothetical protein
LIRNLNLETGKKKLPRSSFMVCCDAVHHACYMITFVKVTFPGVGKHIKEREANAGGNF